MPLGMYGQASVPANAIKPSLAAAILRIAPGGSSPLFAMTGEMKPETAINTVHGYLSKTLVIASVTLTVAALATDTLLTVASTVDIIPGMLLQVDTTGEQMRVMAVNSPTTLTVARATGWTPAAAIAIGVAARSSGNAQEQGSLRPVASAIQMVEVQNETQIFRNSFAVSRTMQQLVMNAGEGMAAENKRDAALLHAIDIENALLFGERAAVAQTVNGQRLTTMDGIVSTVKKLAPANYTIAAATTNFTQLQAMIDPVFDTQSDLSGGSERIAFVGKTAFNVINQIGRLNGNYQLLPERNDFGLRFTTLRLPRGDIRLMEHPLLTGGGLARQKMMIVCDIPSFNIAYLGGKQTEVLMFNDPRLNRGYQVDNGIDGMGGTYTTECTAMFKNAAANAVVTNLTAGALG
jgi:hypothetical protein